MQLRVVAAVAVLVSAGVHLKLWFDGVRYQTVGVPFLLNAVGGLVIAVLLLDVAALGAAVPGARLRTVDHRGVHHRRHGGACFGDHEHWTGGYVWTALIAEAVAIVAGGLLLPARQPAALTR